MNLGSINENDFKESKAVAIAKNIIEENRCFKTFFCEMDKRPNLDGHMSFICLLYTSPSPRDGLLARMPSSA